MKQKAIIVLALGVFFSTIAHSASALSGYINSSFLERFQTLISKKEVIVLNSYGGDAEVAEEVSHLLFENRNIVIFNSTCASACVEYLVITQNSVRALKDTIFIYHHNAHLYFHAALTLGIPRDKLSEIAERASVAAELQARAGISEEIWRVQSDAIGLRLERKASSHRISEFRHYTHVAWMPSSAEMERLLDREVVALGGPICNDDPECLQRRINGLYPNGLTVMTGFGVMTSQGPGPASGKAHTGETEIAPVDLRRGHTDVP